MDTHTVGEFTRIVVSGFPKLEGNTMIERKNYLAEHYDHFRQALMFDTGTSRHVWCCCDRTGPEVGVIYGYRRVSEHVRTWYNRYN